MEAASRRPRVGRVRVVHLLESSEELVEAGLLFGALAGLLALESVAGVQSDESVMRAVRRLSTRR